MSELIHLYTDGSAIGNPGPGGYGLILEWRNHTKTHSQGFVKTTNNRMELLAVIVGLEMLKKAPMGVIVFSDSKYVVDAVEKKWVFKWEKINFKNKKNADLWKRFLIIYKKHKVTFRWIKGHNNHPQNERCDRMAVAAAKGRNLLRDHFFEMNELSSKS